jgi:transposase-like protein
MVPFAPFRDWLRDRHRDAGSYSALAKRTQINPDTLSNWLRDTAVKRTVRRATVEQALAGWGEGTTFNDLYARRQP